jgi:hypothetical protein
VASIANMIGSGEVVDSTIIVQAHTAWILIGAGSTMSISMYISDRNAVTAAALVLGMLSAVVG